jgi:hypothetical protein
MTPQAKLKQLRKLWKENPSKRKVIELQARIVKRSMNYVTKELKEDLELQEQIVDELLK